MKHSITFHTIRLAKNMQKAIAYNKPPLSLSNSEASALLLIATNENISQSQIANHLHLERASIVFLIDNLEKSGYVARTKPQDGDRRRYAIQLTNLGQKTAELVRIRTQHLENRLAKSIPPQELHAFANTLEKITQALDQMKGGENEVSKPQRALETGPRN